MRFRILITALLPLAFTACLSGTETITYPNVPIEQTTFASSLNVNLATSTKTASGLYYRDVVVGTGAAVTSTSRVSVYYSGNRADGSRFDSISSPSDPLTRQLGSTPPTLIQGWEEGLVGMKVGGTRQLVIPPSLGYGEAGIPGVIPPNAVLVFTIQLVNVQ
jgi:FKBP-type peptidyl-prolyl cis-trans isomerase